MKTRTLWIGGSVIAAAIAIMPQVLAQSAGTKSPAVYWMTAETSAGMMGGMGAPGGAGARGGGMNMSGMLGGLLGGRGGGGGTGQPPSYNHLLHLQLGTSQKPAGSPTAEHVPPQGLQTGTLPLDSPKPVRNTEPSDPTEYARQMGKPKGRMLIYWGCGEHAPAGQPVVIDFANLTAGKVPAGFATGSLPTMNPPSASAYASYGEWPNVRSDVTVPPTGKLAGAHAVHGNYTPQIQFAIAPDQDFLPPVVLDSQEASSSGAVPLAWRSIAGARAWLVSTIGATKKGDVVLWTSASSQIMAMGLDFVPQDSIPGLIQKGTLLPGSATQCTVPAEVAKAGEGAMLRMVALGGEANFSFPARPKNAPPTWQPDWVAKVRVKSTYGGLLGMDLAAMMSGRN
jgi:hypothetical protein